VVCEEITFAHGAGPRRLVLATLGRGLWTAEVRRPTAQTFGSACIGQASPPLLAVDPAAPARLGRVMTFRGSNLSNTVPEAWLMLGLSDQLWGGVPLPFPLDGIGMTGCALQVSLDATFTGAVGAGAASWNFGLPASAQFLGVSLFAQVLAVEPGANPASLVVSRPLRATLGW
jgi:hypothetical protein